MATAITWAGCLAMLIVGTSCTTTVDAETRKIATFKSIDEGWVLKIRNGEGRLIEQGAPQIWRGTVGRALEGREIKSTFVWTYVVAGEADDQQRALSMRFAKEDCRDSEGKSYPFSITLHFEGSPAQGGCGNRLP
ncbi:hypothetical protein [Sphingobium agri]|uniref:Lipoprotein n=1 Tax=Sphingobium agri TaxID=2933566 RepID=A0ABT0DUA4_9SPHN|nr:hypothetical protein [Sphingobium agri]MCK0530687.1 hypothetical protein [Sphingobium agri]